MSKIKYFIKTECGIEKYKTSQKEKRVFTSNQIEKVSDVNIRDYLKK